MPTILLWNGFRFHFFSNEGNEPPHVHIRKAEKECKFWIETAELAYNDGMTSTEVRRLRDVVDEHRDEFLRRWHDYFG